MAIVKSAAVPVRITEYSETSLIAAFLTRDFGLVRTIFKGARRKAKAYGSVFDLLVLGELTFYERSSGLNILKGFAAKEDFPQLHAELERYRAAMSCLELVRAAAVEGEPAAGLFDLFHSALQACAAGRFPWQGAYAFLTAGLADTGFAPLLEVCASCAGREFPPGGKARTAFSFEEGGILCMKCGARHKVGMWLTGGALETLRRYLRARPFEASEQQLKPALTREVRGFLSRYCEFTFEQRFRMLK